MALAPIAPWIIPPDYTAVAARGAQLGLSAREADLQQQSAGDRLSLAYNQLASEEKRAHEAAKANLDLAHAKLDMKGQQMDMLHQYRQDRLDKQQQGLDLREKTMTNAANRLIHVGGKLVDAAGNEIFDANAGSLSDVKKMQFQSALATRRAAQLQINKGGLTPGAKAGLASTIAKAEAEMAAIMGGDATAAPAVEPQSDPENLMQQFHNMTAATPAAPVGPSLPANEPLLQRRGSIYMGKGGNFVGTGAALPDLPASTGTAAGVVAPPGKVAIRRKKDGAILYYPASRKDEVPTADYEVLP